MCPFVRKAVMLLLKQQLTNTYTACKCICHQALRPKFILQDPHGGKRELTPKSCPLTPRHMELSFDLQMSACVPE